LDIVQSPRRQLSPRDDLARANCFGESEPRHAGHRQVMWEMDFVCFQGDWGVRSLAREQARRAVSCAQWDRHIAAQSTRRKRFRVRCGEEDKAVDDGEKAVERSKQDILRDQNDAFVQWLDENEVYVKDVASWGRPAHSLVIAIETTDDFEPSGRGLLARRSINQGDLLFEVPERLALTKKKAQEVFGQGVITDGMDEFVAIALLLISERAKGRESFWKTYIDILPPDEELNALFRWSEEETALLAGSPTLVAAQSLRKKLENEYELLCEEVMQSRADLFPKDTFTFDAWEWAFAVLFSRCICLPSTQELALVPYADLLNHSAFCSTFFDSEEGGFMADGRNVVLYADRTYNQTEQVYVTYGQKSNAELLLLYGFVVERNPFDAVEISVSLGDKPTDEDDKVLFQQKVSTLREAGLQTTERFPLFQDRYPKELIEFLRFCCASKAELDADVDFGEFVSSTNEEAVAEALTQACQEALDAYPNSIEDDDALLRDRKMYSLLSQNMKWAVRHRRSEKRILLRTISNIERERKKPAYMFSGSAVGNSGKASGTIGAMVSPAASSTTTRNTPSSSSSSSAQKKSSSFSGKSKAAPNAKDSGGDFTSRAFESLSQLFGGKAKK